MLYIIATPIGNLSDITLRAIDVLRQVDYIAAEDTRKTGLLLKKLQIKKRQISFHEYNKESAARKIIRLLENGNDVAMVTSAGTPAISDPGFVLVREAIRLNITFTSIPGPTAFVTALVLSGLPTDSFTFRGFVPRKKAKRKKFLSVDKDSSHTLIFYESPYRLKAFLQDALEVFGDRPAALAKELTKKFEAVQRGPLSKLVQNIPAKPKGEYTVVIAGAKIKITDS